MAEASIPVHLFNPGQVFACLGFLEAADVLLGDAEGGFDWRDEANVRFMLHTASDENPFAVVLKFLAEAEVHRCAPIGYTDPPLKKKAPADDDGDDEEDSAPSEDLRLSESFPDRQGDRMALPIRLELGEGLPIELDHSQRGQEAAREEGRREPPGGLSDVSFPSHHGSLA